MVHTADVLPGSTSMTARFHDEQDLAHVSELVCARPGTGHIYFYCMFRSSFTGSKFEASYRQTCLFRAPMSQGGHALSRRLDVLVREITSRLLQRASHLWQGRGADCAADKAAYHVYAISAAEQVKENLCHAPPCMHVQDPA